MVLVAVICPNGGIGGVQVDIAINHMYIYIYTHQTSIEMRTTKHI
jgi:hypothetical protein